jgi:hypothetical protein
MIDHDYFLFERKTGTESRSLSPNYLVHSPCVQFANSAGPASMTSVLPSAIFLGLAALAALLLAFLRRPAADNGKARLAASQALAITIAVQAAHFTEELATGFPDRFPAQFGLPGMPYSFFIAFNLAWIAIWVASIPGLRLAQPATYFAAWFLAIAGILSGVGHPLMAIQSGGYFPGLVTAPLIGIAGVWLWRRLYAATATGPTKPQQVGPLSAR